jgi:hypothetical protein
MDKFSKFWICKDLDGTSAFSREFCCEQAWIVEGNSSVRQLSCKLHQAGSAELENYSVLYTGLLIAAGAK